MSENNQMNGDERENRAPEEEMEEDLVIFETEDGEEVAFRLVDYFYYNGEEYALLTEAGEEEEEDENGLEVIVCRVETGEDENGEETEELINIDDEELAQKLIRIANTQLLEDEEADE